jgi:xanthine dehydrogenase YagS FAD-binding subunit
LQPNEVVTEVFVPKPKLGTKSAYIKFKEKSTMDFALAAAAVAILVEGGICRSARVVLGGVAPKPWFVDAAALIGQRLTEDRVAAFADGAFKEAKPLRDNAFKVPLGKAMVKRAVMGMV